VRVLRRVRILIGPANEERVPVEFRHPLFVHRSR
jgi:hypothetical protein